MSSKIRVLNEHIINQIAAGEVIENPASVIKELVENAIDAQATDITVEIKGGGKQLIRVSDNGCGMNEDDAILCLERHATSKLRQLDDLHSLSTMGFRGEAIPSIASISKMTILTRPQTTSSEYGTLVLIEGGKIISSSRAACAAGTSMEVKNLFYNVPVRKKFQKSPQQDSQECLRVLSLQALAHPEISFHFFDNQESILSCQACSKELGWIEKMKIRIQDVLGSHFLEETIRCDYSEEGIEVKGWLGGSLQHRPNRTGQYLFINQRPVVSTTVSYAVKEGYGTILPAQRFPVFVLHISIHGNEVDINVHPQKKEVRISCEQQLRNVISKAVQKALTKPYSPAPEPIQNEHFVFKPYSQPSFSFPTPEKKPEMQIATFQFVQKPRMKVIGTLPGFILIDGNSLPESIHGKQDGLVLVDQKAAQARVIFEQLLQALQDNLSDPLFSQSLLIPDTLELSKPDAALLTGCLADLSKIGWQIREFGPQTFLIEGVPSFMSDCSTKDYLTQLLNELRENPIKKDSKNDKMRQLALSASRNNMSMNKKISLEEAQILIDKLMQTSAPYQSPFGKLTLTIFSQDDLLQFFKG